MSGLANNVVAATPAALTIPGGIMYTINRIQRGRFPDEEWLTVRTRFVLNSGWLPQWSVEREIDAWDNDARTTQLVCAVAGTVISGMRLTQVADADSCMTARMFAARPAMVARVVVPDRDELTTAACQGRLFDVTRFATRLMPTKATATLQELSYPIMFGALVGHTVTLSDGDDPLWIFATTANLLRYLTAIGVRPHVLTRSLPDDTDHDDTIVCVIHPVRDYEDMVAATASRREKLVSAGLTRGFDHARAMAQHACPSQASDARLLHG